MEGKVVVWVALFAVMGFVLGAWLVGSKLGGGAETTTLGCPALKCPECSNPDLMVFYLYPKRCVSCNVKNPPESCMGCERYYDVDVVNSVSEDIGVHLTPYVADMVNEPSVLIAYKSVSALGSAKNKYNIAKSICAVAGVKSACNVSTGLLGGLQSCLAGYNVSEDTVVYYQLSGGCEFCEQTRPYVEELEALNYSDGTPYKVAWFDSKNDTQKAVLEKCVNEFVDLRYVPLVFCPANGFSKTGAMKLSDLRDFADDCFKAAGRK